MNAHYRQHALDCGINLTSQLAMPTEDCAGYLSMRRIDCPETCRPIMEAGIILDIQLIELLQSYGVDYVIVYETPVRLIGMN